ncbi:MAG: DinB family protein [Dehalococcoidia bacterium]
MQKPNVPPLAITPYWASVQDDLLRIVDLMPAGKMNWTPSDELWNSRGILIHVSDARDSWMAGDVKDGDPYPNIWTTARTRDDLKRELVRTFDRVQRFLANQAQLDKRYTPAEPAYPPRDGHWIAFHLLEHDIHHRTELMQRLALMGVTHGIDL